MSLSLLCTDCRSWSCWSCSVSATMKMSFANHKIEIYSQFMLMPRLFQFSVLNIFSSALSSMQWYQFYLLIVLGRTWWRIHIGISSLGCIANLLGMAAGTPKQTDFNKVKGLFIVHKC
jgi:hypothetical protein